MSRVRGFLGRERLDQMTAPPNFDTFKAIMVVQHSPKAAGTRDRLTRLLRLQGESAVGALAGQLRLTTMAVRKHLDSLEAVGLVQYRTEARPIGRPRRLYALTAAASGLFPQAYEELAADLLAHLRAVGGDAAVGVFFERRAHRLQERYGRTLGNLPLPERARQLAELREADGFMACCWQEADGTISLSEHNCPFRTIVEANPEICAAEMELFRAILGGEVQRRRWMPEAGNACEFVIGAPAGGSRAASSG